MVLAVYDSTGTLVEELSKIQDFSVYLYIGNNDNFPGYVGGSPYLGGRV